MDEYNYKKINVEKIKKSYGVVAKEVLKKINDSQKTVKKDKR